MISKKIMILMALWLSFFPFSSVKALTNIHTPIDILIDVGHGGIDGGASYEGVVEKHMNLAVGKALYKQLSSKGYTVILNRMGDYALSDDNSWLNTHSRHTKDLAQRKHLAKEVAPRIMVSLHMNTSKNPKKSGALVLYQKNHQSYLLAQVIQHTLNSFYKTTEKPVARTNLYLLNHSICPTVIVEMGYITNQSDRKKMIDPAHPAKIADAICSAIDTYFVLLKHASNQDLKKGGIGFD